MKPQSTDRAVRARRALVVAALLAAGIVGPVRAEQGQGPAPEGTPRATAGGGPAPLPGGTRAAQGGASIPGATANGESPLAACRPEGPEPSPCAATVRPAATVAAALSATTLEDSKGRAWNLGEIAAQPVLLIVAGRKGSEQAVAWGEGLHRRHPGGLALWATPSDPLAVVVVSDADLHEVPGVIRGIVRWRIASVVADREREGHLGPPLLLDWEGRVARAADIDTSGDAVVVLLDATRTERARFSGVPTDAMLDALGAAIDQVRSHGSAAARDGVASPRATGAPTGAAPEAQGAGRVAPTAGPEGGR